MIETKCSKCGNIKLFTDDKAGRKFKCPSCEEVIQIEGQPIIITPVQSDTVSYQQNIVEQEDRMFDLQDRAENKNEKTYQKMLKRSRVWRNWSYVFAILCFMSICMVFSGETEQTFSILLWGGFYYWFRTKAERFGEDAETYKKENVHLEQKTGLNHALKSGVLTDEEYRNKKAVVERELKLQSLNKALQSGILTQEEYDRKVRTL